jgi:hypothetical protein
MGVDMSRRRETGKLTTERRAAMLAQLALIAEQERQLTESKKVLMAVTWAEGVTDMDMAGAIGGVSEKTVNRWRREGEQLRSASSAGMGEAPPVPGTNGAS